MRLKEWRGEIRRHRFAILFASLLITLVIGPLLDTLWRNANAEEVLATLNLFVAVCSLGLGRTVFRWYLGLALAAVLMRWILFPIRTDLLIPAGRLLWVSLSFAVSVGIFRVVLGSGRVDSERIFAALSLYLLFGLAFGDLFAIIETSRPGSLAGIKSSGAGVGSMLSQAIYFSYVTLATLGYGDIAPITPLTRGLVNVESIVGQLYLAVLIARLVSLYGRHESSDSLALNNMSPATESHE